MRIRVLGGAVATAVVLVGCSGQGGGDAGKLSGAGSTFVEPMMNKWAEVYKNEKKVEVNYQGQGSGAGITAMTEKSVDFGCTDAYMKDEQLAKARAQGSEVVHIPLVMGAVVPAYNLPGIDKPLQFTGDVLADIFLEKIKKWNDPRIQSINPGIELPKDLEISTVHRSDSSGTTSIFTDYLSKVSTEWKAGPKSGTTVNWPGGVGQPGNPGVAGHISKTPGSIGYLELIYALRQKDKIKYGSVKNQAGKYVTGSLETVTKAADASLSSIPDDLRYSITNAPGEESYPISGTVWAVLYVDQPAGKGQQVVDFLRWVTHEGQAYAKDLHYAPLPPSLVQRIDKKLADVKIGK
jgi:phosphate transport system substrate-binding protein